jgi:hypothetical protein
VIVCISLLFGCKKGGGTSPPPPFQGNAYLCNSKATHLSATTRLAEYDNLGIEMDNLKAYTHYTVLVTNDATQETEGSAYLTSDGNGDIPFTVIAYELLAGSYTLTVAGGAIVTQFTVDKIPSTPRVIPCDANGNYRNHFSVGDDIYVRGSGYDNDVQIEIYITYDRAVWENGVRLVDRTATGADLVFTNSLGEIPVTLVWEAADLGQYDPNPEGEIPCPRGGQGLPSEVANNAYGSFDIVVDRGNLNGHYDDYDDILRDFHPTGFVLQSGGHGGSGVNDLYAQLSSNRNRNYIDMFAPTEDVWCWINPDSPLGESDRYIDRYIVKHKDNWLQGDELKDVSGPNPEGSTIQTGCTNMGNVLIWPAPLDPGEYDIIIDFNRNGIYDEGVDILDGTNVDGTNVGFRVAQTAKAEWSVFIYMSPGAGVSDLSPEIQDDIIEMENAGDSNYVNIAVQADSSSYTTKRFIISTIHSQLTATQVKDLGEELNSGDPEVLKDFLVWACLKYPAKHYALILWDHGGGIFSRSKEPQSLQGKRIGDACCWNDEADENGRVSYIDVLELEDALDYAVDLTGQRFDLIGFDCCLMGMVEFAHEMSEYADIMVASADWEQLDGWEYQSFLPQLITNPTNTNAKDIADNIIDGFATRYGTTGAANTLGSFDLSVIPAFNTALDDFVDELINQFATYDSEIHDARDACYWFCWDCNPPGLHWRDFRQFVTETQNNIDDVTIDNLGNGLLGIYDDALVIRFHGSVDYNEANGLSIWLPPASEYDPYVTKIYDRTDFAADNSWIDFIAMLD